MTEWPPWRTHWGEPNCCCKGQNGIRAWNALNPEVDKWIWMRDRMVTVSGAYLVCIGLPKSEWVVEWPLCLGCICIVSEYEWITEWLSCLECIWDGEKVRISDRMATVSRAYLDCIWSWDLVWVAEWLPCLECIWTVTGIWISDRMTSVSGVYLNLKLIVESDWEIEWLPCLKRI